MLFKIAHFKQQCFATITIGIALNSSLAAFASHTANQTENKSTNLPPHLNYLPSNLQQESLIIASTTSVLPEAVKLVKKYEGFRSYAYIDSSGLPVIGYGQTIVNGRRVQLGQFITPAQANTALEKELYHIQKLVLANVKVELNPYQLGALTSLVYNAGAVIVKNSTLIRKLNTGDYAGAAREFPRWNKANRGGQLVVFPGLTKRRIAEQQLFLTPYRQIVSSN